MGFSGTLILLLPVPGEHPGAAAPPIGGPPGEPQREKTGATWGEQVRVSSRPLLPLLRLLHPAFHLWFLNLHTLPRAYSTTIQVAQHPASRTWAPAKTRQRSWTPRSDPREASWLEDPRDQTHPSVCSFLVNLGLGAGLTLDLAPPLAQLSRETT